MSTDNPKPGTLEWRLWMARKDVEYYTTSLEFWNKTGYPPEYDKHVSDIKAALEEAKERVAEYEAQLQRP